MATQYKKVLVTGHKGALGSQIAPYLESKGLEVVGYDVREDPADDIFDAERLEEKLEGCDAAIHLVAHPHRGSAPSWPDFRRLNVEGSQAVFESVMRVGTPKFVYCSTGNLYCFGDGIQDDITPPVKLDDVPLADDERVHWYPRSKLIVESWLEARVFRNNQRPENGIVILRPNWIASPPQPQWFDACVSWPKLQDGFYRATVVDFTEPIMTFDLIEDNPNYEGSVLAEKLLFNPNI